MLKSKKGQPFYKDFWFWVKILIFVVELYNSAAEDLLDSGFIGFQ